MSALEDTAVPTPRVLRPDTGSGIADVPLVLMEFIDGLVVDTDADRRIA